MNDVIVDLKMSWGEWAGVYARFAEAGEVRAVRAMRKDLAHAMSASQALNQLIPNLTDEQLALVHRVFFAEMEKQGFAL